jgi:hypothetical protein
MRRALWIGLAITSVAAVAIVLWAGSPDGGGEVTASSRPPPAESIARAPEPAPEASAFDHVIESGETLALDSASLPSGRPLVLKLALGEPSRSADPRPVRVIAPDGRLLHLSGALVADDRRSAEVEIDPDWLAPGRYVVEVKTTEKSHFPLRRYALEVR